MHIQINILNVLWFVTNAKSISLFYILLIHQADPQSRPVVITIFARVVCPSIPTFQNLAKQNNSQVRIVIDTGGTVGLA